MIRVCFLYFLKRGYGTVPLRFSSGFSATRIKRITLFLYRTAPGLKTPSTRNPRADAVKSLGVNNSLFSSRLIILLLYLGIFDQRRKKFNRIVCIIIKKGLRPEVGCRQILSALADLWSPTSDLRPPVYHRLSP